MRKDQTYANPREMRVAATTRRWGRPAVTRRATCAILLRLVLGSGKPGSGAAGENPCPSPSGGARIPPGLAGRPLRSMDSSRDPHQIVSSLSDRRHFPGDISTILVTVERAGRPGSVDDGSEDLDSHVGL